MAVVGDRLDSVADTIESRGLVLWEEEVEAIDDRRNEVRMPAEERRERIDWNRVVCIMSGLLML